MSWQFDTYKTCTINVNQTKWPLSHVAYHCLIHAVTVMQCTKKVSILISLENAIKSPEENNGRED